MDKQTFWQKLKFKYRISIINEETLAEHHSLKLSIISLFVLLCLMLVLSFVVFALAIWYTPLRNYLPGYNENIRQELINQSIRVDSLMQQLDVQSQYLGVIRDVVAGEVETDSVQMIDSLSIEQKEELLATKSEDTENFMAQYEEKEKDYLSIFDPQHIVPSLTFFKPVDGEIIVEYDLSKGHTGVSIQTVKNQNVTSVLSGNIIYAYYDIDNEWVLMLQYDNNYIAVYKNISKVLKKVGDKLRIGESFGIVSDSKPLYFELWQNGQTINPKDVITF